MKYKEAVKRARKIMTNELRPEGFSRLRWKNTSALIMSDVREFGYDKVLELHKHIPLNVLQRVARMAIMIDED